jgi:glycosyltransferase involved in cell wall biosynthesis
MATRLNDKGFKVVCVTHKTSELAEKLKKTALPSTAVRIGNLSFLNIFKLLKLKRFFCKENISVVVMNLPSDLKAAGMAAKWAGVKRIIYRRGSAIPIRNSFFNRTLFGRIVTDVIANSQATKKTILAHNKHLFPEEKIKVIYNGLDLAFKDAPSPHRFCAARCGDIILGNAGRMVYQKGHELLLEVAHHLKTEGIGFTLLLAGTGPLEADLRRKADQLELREHLRFLGFVEDMRAFMHSIDIFLLSSRWEGFGYVLAEAMAAAKPIVAFDVSSNPELVRHGVNGFLAAPFDTRQFAHYLMMLIKNRNLRENFGQKGLERVQREFAFDRVIQEFVSMIT